MLISSGLIILLCAFTFADRPTTCPYGYDQIDRQCFKIVDLSLTFFEAVTACDVIDGKVLQIADQGEQEKITNYLNGKMINFDSLWLGLTNLQGEWRYLDSHLADAVDYWNSWVANNPKPATNEDGNNCVSVTKKSGWKWENVPCTYHQGVVCARRLRDDSTTTTRSYYTEDNSIVG